jgi:hypothetical protein
VGEIQLLTARPIEPEKTVLLLVRQCDHEVAAAQREALDR